MGYFILLLSSSVSGWYRDGRLLLSACQKKQLTLCNPLGQEQKQIWGGKRPQKALLILKGLFFAKLNTIDLI